MPTDFHDRISSNSKLQDSDVDHPKDSNLEDSSKPTLSPIVDIETSSSKYSRSSFKRMEIPNYSPVAPEQVKELITVATKTI